MRPFSINIRGRVKNFNLPKNQPLVPLFEAIVNAIHAIGERKSTDPSFEGQIIIRILRDGQFVLDGTGELPQIQSFEIIDNGIGFNEANIATVYKGNIIKNLIMDCQSYTKYRPNETTGGIFVSWRRKEELPTGA